MLPQDTSKRIKDKEFATTQTATKLEPHTYLDIIDYVTHTVQDWSGLRQPLEEDWKAAWAEWFSNTRSAEMIRQEAVLQLGDVQTDWRYKVPTGKAFELVEDANSYLQSAFFPNKQWFDLYPKEPMQDPEWEDTLRVMQKYVQHKLDEAHFQDWWEINCRQALITGTSVLALPWRYDVKQTIKNFIKYGVDGKKKVIPQTVDKVVKNGLDLEVVDMFDFYLDPYATESRDCNCVRRFTKTKGELIRLVKEGVYPLATVAQIQELTKSCYDITSSTEHKADKMNFTGAAVEAFNPNDVVTCYEFWGDIILEDIEYIDVCATICGGMILSFMPNPFWGGKPFVVTKLVNIQGSPYGQGLLTPVLGQLHQLFVTMNHRLDIGELVVNPMWKVVQDGTLDLNSLYSAPAKIIPVGDLNNIEPITFDVSSLGVNVQEESMLEQRIERVTGITPYVGQGQGRDAERVTAEEVKSKREAGGNRLGRYHKHIEETSLSEVLEKTYLFMQQFVTDDEVIRVNKPLEGTTQNAYEFIQVGAEELENDLDIIPVGSDWVIDKEREIRERVDFVTLISEHPQMSQMVNWEEVMKDLARRLVKQDWERYLKLGANSQAEMGTPSPEPSQEEMMLQQMMQQQAQQKTPEVAVPLEQRLAQGVPPEMQAAVTQSLQNPKQLEQIVNSGE